MIQEEVEVAKEAAIVINENVLLRSSQNALSDTVRSFLPLYHIVFKTHLVRGNSRYPSWSGSTYGVESCAVWEVLYLNTKAPPLLPSLEERPLSDTRRIADGIQRMFPTLDYRRLLTSAVTGLLNAHYNGESKIIVKVDGVFGIDPDFIATRLLDYEPQKPVVKQKKPIFFEVNSTC